MEIKLDPYPTLYTVSTPVEQDELKEVVNLARQAHKLLAKTDHGVGLAANQVGDTRRWFIMTLGDKKKKYIVINPELVEESDSLTPGPEGCLSKPGKDYTVWRPLSIKVRWTSEKGTTINKRFVDFEARVFLHELDHLNGKNIWDKEKEEQEKPTVFQSCAQWPEGTLCAQEDQITKDVNGTFDAAEAVCERLASEGFGGERKIFPLRVWVEPVKE